MQNDMTEYNVCLTVTDSNLITWCFNMDLIEIFASETSNNKINVWNEITKRNAWFYVKVLM